MKTKAVKKKIRISASVQEVWNAITDPEIVKQYFFGTNVESEWKEGKPIIYSGSWEGKSYQDKGEILEIEEEKLLSHTYWSSMDGAPDTPENYYTVTYSLDEKGDDETILTVTQEGENMSKESAHHSGKNWEHVLEDMKRLLEAHPAHR